MGYFRRFEPRLYRGSSATNILSAVLPSRMNIDQAFVYQKYTIADGETPEGLAERFYGDANLYWTILVANDLIDPLTDWPVADDVFEEFVTLKYGSLYGVHHYLDNQNDRMADDLDDAKYRQADPGTLPFYIVPITNMEHERELNNQKRGILIINPNFISQFVEIYGRAIEGSL